MSSMGSTAPTNPALAENLATTQPERAEKTPDESNSSLPGNEQTHSTNLSTEPEEGSSELKAWIQASTGRLSKADYAVRGSGVVFKNLSVSGAGVTVSTQNTIGSILTAPFRSLFHPKSKTNENKKQVLKILSNFSGILKPGELLAVLGRPGAGCSTFLKAISGDLYGLTLDPGSIVEYNGISQHEMLKHFRGEVNYNPEIDRHFPHLTVEQTLVFAAALRTPHTRLDGLSRDEWARETTQSVMALYGLSHAKDTQVGDDFVRGVSGGERKRVSIAEMTLSGSTVACWDQSTRGLDSSSALNFAKSLRGAAQVMNSCHIASMYQASDAILRQFDKVVLLYEGEEIYFGPVKAAKIYFETMGWVAPPRLALGDFLTSITNPAERKIRPGYEDNIPRTPKEFASHWLASQEGHALQKEIVAHEETLSTTFPEDFAQAMNAKKGPHAHGSTPYLVSTRKQIQYCGQRAYHRLWNDKTATLAQAASQVVMSLIVGSMFYNTPNNTDGLFSKGGILFGAIMLNAMSAITEIFQLYSHRPIVEKQASYALYHPWTEALSGWVLNIPIKLAVASTFNVSLYFLSGLRREPSNFFIFFLFLYTLILTMSCIFRTIGAATKHLPQAFAVVGVVLPLLVIYTGYVIPKPSMHPWFKWITYINPVAWAFESLIANEFHGEQFTCASESIVPPYGPSAKTPYVCAARGAAPNQLFVTGDAFMTANFQYSYSHLWRNYGIICAMLVFFLVLYLAISNVNIRSPISSSTLVFREGHVPKKAQAGEKQEKERSHHEPSIKTGYIGSQTDTFSWHDISYDIHVKNGSRKLLDDVSGYVKPGTLTALMGVSGAGKTTLLDVISQRVTEGNVRGTMLVNGSPLEANFQRNTGYVQQQDIHVETTTVREALRFSAILRQPRGTTIGDKFASVERVIDMLGMSDFAEGIVGVPGQGLNTEQRKLLTIGVELAANPSILLFLDEPTTGLDSQSAWGVINFIRKLANQGTTILCTIHQPSSVLFDQFDRLLLLAEGGKTVYFGDVGVNSQTMIRYFERNGARTCGPGENPAEYMLEVVSDKSTQDWTRIWKASPEYRATLAELAGMQEPANPSAVHHSTKDDNREFALPLWEQMYHVTKRAFQQYWRTPKYAIAKIFLGIASSLFIGFTFYKVKSSVQGIQNMMFAVFMQAAIFPPLVNQIMPKFVAARSQYEVRERPSRAYSWIAFIISTIVVEIPYQIVLGIVVFIIWNFTVLGVQDSSRAGLLLLYFIQFFVFASTFAHMMIAALPDAETAAQLAIVTFILSLLFSGVLQPVSSLPHFWHFLWRVSPLTYWISGIVATGSSGKTITCESVELSIFNPPSGANCAAYLKPFFETMHAPGYLVNPNATTGCQYCPLSNADQFLATRDVYWGLRWRNLGLGFVYIGFNIGMAVFVYWAFRLGNWKKVFVVFRKSRKAEPNEEDDQEEKLSSVMG